MPLGCTAPGLSLSPCYAVANCCCSAALAGFIIAHGRPCCAHRELLVRTESKTETTTTTTTASRRVLPPPCRPHPPRAGPSGGPKPRSAVSFTLCECVMCKCECTCCRARRPTHSARRRRRWTSAQKTPSLALAHQRPFVPPPRHWLCPPRRRACATSQPAAHRESSEWACRRGLLIPSAAPLQERLPSSRGRRRHLVALLDPRAASRLPSHHMLFAASASLAALSGGPSTARCGVPLRPRPVQPPAPLAEPQGSLTKQASDSNSPTHWSHAVPPPHQHSTALSVRAVPQRG
jgi:hypothetical protein